MSAPFLWILLPGIIAIVLFLIRRLETVVIFIGFVVTLLLAVLAWQLQIEAPIQLGPLSIKIADTLEVLGRQFILSDQDRPLLAFIYSVSALWFGVALLVRPGYLFVPIALGMVALLTASIAVNPFLFAALFILIAVLLSMPLMVPPGEGAGTGALRYLTYQTLGMPFILFTGWMLAGVEASPGDLELVIRASILLGFGFAFLLGIVPFHTWIPMTARQVHPFIGSFVYINLLGIIAFFGLGFIDRFVWLRDSPVLFDVMLFSGLLMILVGAVWSSFERDLARIMGFAVVIEGGLSLLAVSLGDSTGIQLFLALLPPRVIGLLVWSVALSVMRSRYASSSLGNLTEVLQEVPLVFGALLIAILSFAGLPLLAGFPVRLLLWQELAAEGILILILAMAGSAGLFMAALRSLQAGFKNPELLEESRPLSRGLTVFFVLAILLLVFFGILPQTLESIAANLLEAFPNLNLFG